MTEPTRPRVRGVAPAPAGEYALGPATRLLWRGPDSVELGLGADGVVVEGLAAVTLRSLATHPGPQPADRPDPLDRPTLAALHRAGYLWPRTGDDPRLAVPSARLAGELRTLQVRHGERAARVLAARRSATVTVEGGHRVGAQVAAALAASGVGRVVASPPGRARLRDAAVGGVGPGDEGGELGAAVRAAVTRAAPEVDQTALGPDERPDLVVFALDHPLAEERRASLHADGVAHLAVALRLNRAVVGPLVVPGVTSCLRCADLVRRDLDPAWDALAVQLTTPGRYGPASGAALALLVAGAAAQQALAYLDGEQPATVDGTLELLEPDWRLRRRSWHAHPECGCVDLSGPASREAPG